MIPSTIIILSFSLHLLNYPLTASSYCEIQEHAFVLVNKYLNVMPSSLWANLTLFGDGTVLVSVISIAIVNTPRVWISLINTSVLTGLCSLSLKHLINTPRPAGFMGSDQFLITGEILTKHSLPSGHTMTVFAGISTLLLAKQQLSSGRSNILGVSALILFALVVGLSRVAVGAHWILDVVYGASLGSVMAFISVQLTMTWPDRWVAEFDYHAGIIIPLLLVAMALSLSYKLLHESIGEPVYGLALCCSLCAAGAMFFRQLGQDTLQPPLLLPNQDASQRLLSLEGNKAIS